MSVQDDLSKLRTAMKLIWEVAHDADIKHVHLEVNTDEEMLKENGGCSPYERLDIGDWTLTFTDADGLLGSYEPRDHSADDWQLFLDPSRIISFTMPPKGEERDE